MRKQLTYLILIFMSLSLMANERINNKVLNFSYNDKEIINGNILIFKSDVFSIIPLDSSSNKFQTNSKTKGVKLITYHLFDRKEKSISVYTKSDFKWTKKEFLFEETKKINTNRFDFICYTKDREKYTISLIQNENDVSIIQDLFLKNEVFYFGNIKSVSIEEFNKLNVDGNNETINSENTKELIVTEIIKDFEYSEYWRSEAYKAVIEYMKIKINESNPNCNMVSRGTYNPNLIIYIGNQGFQVKILCGFDCKQNYINKSYFWVDTYYLGNNKWDLEVVDQRITD